MRLYCESANRIMQLGRTKLGRTKIEPCSMSFLFVLQQTDTKFLANECLTDSVYDQVSSTTALPCINGNTALGLFQSSCRTVTLG